MQTLLTAGKWLPFQKIPRAASRKARRRERLQALNPVKHQFTLEPVPSHHFSSGDGVNRHPNRTPGVARTQGTAPFSGSGLGQAFIRRWIPRTLSCESP